MKNFLQVNRALVAEKNIYLNLNQLPSKNDGGQSCDGNRQSRVMSQSGCSAVDVPMTSYGAPDEHPMSIRSASDGTRWNSRGWKYVAMIFAVLVMSIANIGMAWGASVTFSAAEIAERTKKGVIQPNCSTAVASKQLYKDGSTAKKFDCIPISSSMGTSDTQTNAIDKKNILFTADAGYQITGITIVGASNSSSTAQEVVLCWTGDISNNPASFQQITLVGYEGTSMPTGVSVPSIPSGTKSFGLYIKVKVDNATTPTALYTGSGCKDYGAGNSQNVYTVTVTYEASTKYTLSYDANGGTGSMPTHEFASGTTVYAAQNAGFTAPSGKIFKCWNTKANGEGTSYSEGASFTLSANTTLYAQWITASTSGSYCINMYDLSGGASDQMKYFTYSGYDDMQILDLEVPNYKTGDDNNFWVGAGGLWKSGDLGNKGASSANEKMKELCLKGNRGQKLGTGSQGVLARFFIYDNSTYNNLYIEFTPKQYSLIWGEDGKDWSPVKLYPSGCENEWTSEVVTLTSDHISSDDWKYYVGILKADDGVAYWYKSKTSTIKSMGTYNKPSDAWGGNVSTLSAGDKGFFRMWQDATSYDNWRCHFVPVYTLSYNANGGEGAPSSAYTATEGDATARTLKVSTTEPTRTGYTFEGWAVSSAHATAGTVDYAPGASITLAADQELWAVWANNQYSVTHSGSNRGVTSGTTGANAATYGTDYTAEFSETTGYNLPATITVTIGGNTTTQGTEYTWDQGTGTVVVDGDYILGDVVITVNGVLKTYTVNFASNNVSYGTVSSSSISSVPHGSTVSINGSTNALTLNGSTITVSPTTSTAAYTYAFSSWSVDNGDEITGTTTITATFTRTAKTYDVDVTLTDSKATKKSGTTGSNAATFGTNHTLEFEAVSGYELPDDVTVTIGGSPATEGTEYTWNSSTGTVVIGGSYILGNISITVTAEEEGGGDCTPINASITFDNNKSAKYNTSWVDGDVVTSGGASWAKNSIGSDTGHPMTKPAMKLDDTGDYIKITLPSGVTTGTITVLACTYSGKTGTLIINDENNSDTPLASAEVGLVESTQTYKINTPDGGSWTAPTLKTLSYDVTSGGDYYIKQSAGNSIYVFAFSATGTKECACSTPSAPTSPTNGATTSNSQAVSWTDASNSAWEVYVSTGSSTPAADQTPIDEPTSASYTFTGLTASTTYYWWVRSVCDDTHKSDWVAGTSFETSAAGEDPIPALISYYLQTPNSKTKPGSLSTDSIITTPKRLKGDTLKNFVPVTLGSSLGITKAGKGDGGTWSAGIGTTPADSATAVTDAYAAKLAFDIHDDYDLNISSITLKVLSVTNDNQIYRVKVSDGDHTVYGRVAPDQNKESSVVFGSFSGIKFSGTVTLTLWVWSNAAAEYRLKSPIQIDGTLTRKVSACTMPTQTFSTDTYTLGDDALDLSTLFSSNSSGAVTYSVVNAGGTSATIVGSSFTASNTGTATIRASQAADGENNKCAKSIETTITVSGTCTPQSLSKVSATKGTSGTVTGYNDGQYAGDAVVNLYSKSPQSASLSGVGTVDGYKMGDDGTSIVFATLKGTSFQVGDKVKIGITKKSDNRTVDASTDILTIYYGTSKTDVTALHTITGVTGAGFYEYALTSADVTAIGSKKGIGLFRESTNGENPFVYSVEIIGCREWAVCTAPNAVAASGATHNSAVLTVTDAEETGNYEFYYSESSTAPTASTAATATGSSLTKTITGLSASTTYYYWVRSNCGGVTKSAWVPGTPATFTTTAAPSTYSVTYNDNGSTGGSVPTDTTAYEEGDIVTVKGNTGSLEKTGSSFVGWNTASDGTGVFYPAGYKFYMDDADVTLYAVYGSVGATCVTLTNFETSSYGKSSNKPDSEGKYFYGYKGTVGADYAVTITTPATDVKGANSGANLLLTQNTRFSIYADNTTTGGTPATFSSITSISFKIKAVKNTKIPTIEVYVGSTKVRTVTGGSESSNTDGHDYDTSGFTTITVSSLSNLAGIVKFVNTSSGSADYKALFDDIQICYGSGASSGYTVSFNMKDHGSAIADIENVPSGSKIGAPVPEPTATDWNFGGWYKETGCTNAWNFESDQVTSDTTLYAKWSNCAPTITTQPVAANYNQNGVAAALTVAANNNGGGELHYQWWVKENDSADEDGSVIPGETGNSYTPSTVLLGTSYYYCVVSNDCGNVKTSTAAVTIRDAKPAPTAVWDVEDPTHGGKGFTFSVVAKQNDEETLWDGTLTADMLSVSSEAVLGTVTVNDETKTISGTYGVKGSATSPVTFYLLLPATETQAAARLDHDQSFDVCAGAGSGTTYNIPMLSAYSSTSSGKPTYHCATAGVGYIAPDVGSSSVTLKAEGYDEFSYYTSSGRQSVLVYSEKDAIKKMRIYLLASGGPASVKSVGTKTGTYSTNTSDYVAFRSDDYDVTYTDEDGNDGIGKSSNGYIELTFATPLEEGTFVYVVLEKNAKFFGAKLIESEGGGTGETQSTTLAWASAPYEAPATYIEKDETALNFTYTATRSGANAEASLGTIVYYSNDESVATVNASTGEVSIADDISWGDATFKDVTITAMLSASGCYEKAELSYTVRVKRNVCEDAQGTIAVTSSSCSSWELTISGYAAGATISWYKEGTVAAVKSGNGSGADTYSATTAGTYYAVTHATCDAISTNEIKVSFTTATAKKIVDEWYVKNDRRTPDIALVQTTNATGFTVTTGSPASDITSTGIGGCTFELKKDGIIYLHGTTSTGAAPSGMTPGDMTITITATACSNATPLDIVLHIQAETTKPSVAFVVDGTLRKDGGTATSVLAAKTSDRPLWKYLANTFALTGCNAYWSVDSKELRQYYSQYDAILITDDPNTSTSGTGGVSYVKAFGTMVDVRPVLTMEAYVGKFKDGGWHVYDATPTSPNPRQVELKLECKNHDIFKGLNPATSDNVRTTRDEYGNEYWHVIMVDTTQSPYHNTKESYEALPALQGFDRTKFSNMLGVGTIFEEKLQGGVERQEEPAARMMILGVQNNAMGALTNEGKLIVKNALEYLLKTNMEDVNDCANYFTNAAGDGQWSTGANWTRGEVPDFETRARILQPVTIGNGTTAIAARVDIAAGGESKHVDGKCTGSITIEPQGILKVGGKVTRAKAPYFGIDNLQPTQPEDLYLKTNTSYQSALIFDNEEGETQATVTVHSEAHYNAENDKDYWQYLTSPLQETPVTEFFYGVGTYTYRHCEAEGGWVRYGLGATFQAFDAIGLTQNAEKDFVFYGPLAPTGEWELNLTKVHSGNNLFGNSWTAPIDLKALVNNTDFDSNINLDLAIYNTGSDRKDGSGEFDQLDKADVRPGTWHHVPLLLATFEDAGWEGLRVIPAYQAFQLKATGAATLNIDYDKCVRGSESANYNEPLHAPRRPGARQAERDIEALRIAVSDAYGIAYIYLLEGNQFTEGYDNGWELGYKANSKYGKLYAISPAQGNMMALARPSLEGTMVGFQRGQSNEYTITFNETEGNYYLNDLKTETSTLIQEGESYTFTVEEGEPENRFLITSIPYEKPGIATGVTDLDADAPKVQKIIYNDKLYIIRGGKVYSAEGQLVK